MATVLVGFLLIATPLPIFRNPSMQFIPAILFFAIPLAALANIVPDHWTAIFRRVGVRDVQCILVIGTARLVLSLAYMKAKNIWVSTGAHIFNDWAIFLLTILGTGLSAG